ncbi:17683_t:CDS:2, partial [Racocetra fulgida]
HNVSVNNSETKNSEAENSEIKNSKEFSCDEVVENKNTASIIKKLHIIARNYYNDNSDEKATEEACDEEEKVDEKEEVDK